MVRRTILALLLLQVAAASAQGAREPPLPVPPVPPPPPPLSAFQDAPVPNRDVRVIRDAVVRPEVAPGVIEAPDTYRGETFDRGVSPADRDARLFTPAPGVTVRVPLRD